MNCPVCNTPTQVSDMFCSHCHFDLISIIGDKDDVLTNFFDKKVQYAKDFYAELSKTKQNVQELNQHLSKMQYDTEHAEKQFSKFKTENGELRKKSAQLANSNKYLQTQNDNLLKKVTELEDEINLLSFEPSGYMEIQSNVTYDIIHPAIVKFQLSNPIKTPLFLLIALKQDKRPVQTNFDFAFLHKINPKYSSQDLEFRFPKYLNLKGKFYINIFTKIKNCSLELKDRPLIINF